MLKGGTNYYVLYTLFFFVFPTVHNPTGHVQYPKLCDLFSTTLAEKLSKKSLKIVNVFVLKVVCNFSVLRNVYNVRNYYVK